MNTEKFTIKAKNSAEFEDLFPGLDAGGYFMVICDKAPVVYQATCKKKEPIPGGFEYTGMISCDEGETRICKYRYRSRGTSVKLVDYFCGKEAMVSIPIGHFRFKQLNS